MFFKHQSEDFIVIEIDWTIQTHVPVGMLSSRISFYVSPVGGWLAIYSSGQTLSLQS